MSAPAFLILKSEHSPGIEPVIVNSDFARVYVRGAFYDRGKNVTHREFNNSGHKR